MYTLLLTFCFNYTCYFVPVQKYLSYDECNNLSQILLTPSGQLNCSESSVINYTIPNFVYNKLNTR